MDVIYKQKQHLADAVVGPNDSVLDVAFWGHGAPSENSGWLHRLLIEKAKAVYGVDSDFDETVLYKINDPRHYLRADVEEFSFAEMKFDIIIASELIEHLPNPGRFLDACARHLAPGGRLVLTTPNCFNFFAIVGKFMHREPYVSPDHTCYFNEPTMRTLLRKKKWEVKSVDFISRLDMLHKKGLKEGFLDLLYRLLLSATPKYAETLVVIAEKA